MSENNGTTPHDGAETVSLDAVIVGAGFGGMYAVHRLHERGMRIIGIEAGGDVGGVWYWNRYPGARCDLMCVDYSYSFSPEIEQEWTWSEQFAAQPEILAYANFVADKLKLREHIRFNTRVTGAAWDAQRQLWTVTADDGTVYEAPCCVLATGPLSIPKDPDIPGLADFAGDVYRAQKWPHHEVDFSTRRVGLIGTGSTGIQIVTEVAKNVGELHVFQRTPSFTLPMRNDRLDAEYVEEIKAHYPGLRAAANASALGGVRPSTTRPFFSLPPRQRVQLMEDAWKMGGHAFLGTFSDLLTNPDANERVADFVRAKIAEVVDDPETAEALTPRGYPIFARRPCLDTDYYQMFNKPNVHLVDLLKDPIAEITATGVRLSSGTEVALDALILATGYDGLTGAMMAFDITGRDGVKLRDKWSHGAQSYLGLMLAGFPNLFMVCGANGPAALANIISINEQNVNWLCGLLDHMAAEGLATFEPTPQAEARWMDLVHTLAEKTLLSKAQTWYVGANVKGKTRGLTMFTGGFSKYREHCDMAAGSGYADLMFQPARSLATA